MSPLPSVISACMPSSSSSILQDGDLLLNEVEVGAWYTVATHHMTSA